MEKSTSKTGVAVGRKVFINKNESRRSTSTQQNTVIVSVRKPSCNHASNRVVDFSSQHTEEAFRVINKRMMGID